MLHYMINVCSHDESKAREMVDGCQGDSLSLSLALCVCGICVCVCVCVCVCLWCGVCVCVCVCVCLLCWAFQSELSVGVVCSWALLRALLPAPCTSLLPGCTHITVAPYLYLAF